MAASAKNNFSQADNDAHLDDSHNNLELLVDESGKSRLQKVGPEKVVVEFRQGKLALLETTSKDVNWYSPNEARPNSYFMKTGTDRTSLEAMANTLLALAPEPNCPVKISFVLLSPEVAKYHVEELNKRILDAQQGEKTREQ